MYIAYTEEQENLRRDLRIYYQRLLTPEIREELHQGRGVGPTMRAVVRLVRTSSSGSPASLVRAR